MYSDIKTLQPTEYCIERLALDMQYFVLQRDVEPVNGNPFGKHSWDIETHPKRVALDAEYRKRLIKLRKKYNQYGADWDCPTSWHTNTHFIDEEEYFGSGVGKIDYPEFYE